MEKLKSRKLWVAILALLVELANAFFDLRWSTEQVLGIAAPAVAYVLGQGYVDGKAAEFDLDAALFKNTGMHLADLPKPGELSAPRGIGGESREIPEVIH